MTLQELRTQYPSYSKVSDEILRSKVNAKYPGMLTDNPAGSPAETKSREAKVYADDPYNFMTHDQQVEHDASITEKKDKKALYAKAKEEAVLRARTSTDEAVQSLMKTLNDPENAANSRFDLANSWYKNVAPMYRVKGADFTKGKTPGSIYQITNEIKPPPPIEPEKSWWPPWGKSKPQSNNNSSQFAPMV